MRPDELTIDLLDDPQVLADLAADARADGRAMVGRLLQEWNDGRNRFDRPGEKAYVARLNGRVCGVCGLNRDPFARAERVGRVRRLYVSVTDRRSGVGSAILKRLMADARGVYEWMHLRTHDKEASAFYEAIGFEPVRDDVECTHRRPVVA
jgi:N-acetylglutamate synthase-like GNAT family acetyltransferase